MQLVLQHINTNLIAILDPTLFAVCALWGDCTPHLTHPDIRNDLCH